MTVWAALGAVALAGLYLLNRAWRRTVRGPIDDAATGDLEELVGNAGACLTYLLAAAVVAALLAAGVLR